MRRLVWYTWIRSRRRRCLVADIVTPNSLGQTFNDRLVHEAVETQHWSRNVNSQPNKPMQSKSLSSKAITAYSRGSLLVEFNVFTKYINCSEDKVTEHTEEYGVTLMRRDNRLK